MNIAIGIGFLMFVVFMPVLVNLCNKQHRLTNHDIKELLVSYQAIFGRNLFTSKAIDDFGFNVALGDGNLYSHINPRHVTNNASLYQYIIELIEKTTPKRKSRDYLLVSSFYYIVDSIKHSCRTANDDVKFEYNKKMIRMMKIFIEQSEYIIERNNINKTRIISEYNDDINV